MNAKGILALALSLIATSAFAGPWKEINATEQESVLIDTSSIQFDGDEIQVKVLRDYPSTRLNLFDGQWYAFRSQLALYSVDCADGKLGHLEWSLHTAGQGRGRVVHAGKVGGVTVVDAPTNPGDRALVSTVCASTVAKLHTQTQLLAAVQK